MSDIVVGWTGLGGPLQITELVRILLNAEMSEVLVVTGLLFLTVAIYADLTGRVNPSRQGRIIGGVIGSVLVVTGLWMAVAVPTNGPNGPTATPTDTSTPTATPTDTPTPTATPTDTPTPTADAPGLDTVEFPPGYSELGYTNRDVAVESLLDALVSRSFTSTTRVEADSTIEIVIQANPETRRVHMIDRRNGSVESESFFDSGTTHIRMPTEAGFREDITTYERAVHFDGQFEEIFFGTTLSNSRVSRDQGRTLITYDVIADDRNGHLTITEDGFIWEYTVHEEVDGETRTFQYVTTNVGETTVEVPRWVDG